MACVDGFDDETGEPCDGGGGEPELEVPEPWFNEPEHPWAGQPGWEDIGSGQWFQPGFGTWNPVEGYQEESAEERRWRQWMRGQEAGLQAGAEERAGNAAERQAAARRAAIRQDRYDAYLDRQLAQNGALTREAMERGDRRHLETLAVQREALESQKEENRKNRQLTARNAYAQYTGWFTALPGEPEPPKPGPGLSASLAAFRGA